MLRNELDGKTIRVSGMVFQINFEKDMESHYRVMALTHFTRQTITIDEDLSDYGILQSLLHELLEIMNRKYSLNMDHALINALDSALMDVLVTNPIVLKELLDYSVKVILKDLVSCGKYLLKLNSSNSEEQTNDRKQEKAKGMVSKSKNEVRK